MDQVRMNLLLMGKTGHGKSLTGNSILGRRCCTVSANMTSVTKEVQDHIGAFENYSVKIIDGPGLKDTTMDAGEDQETAAEKMLQALAKCDGGVDAFLFVYKYGARFTEEERNALEGLKQIFGEDYFKHLIVVVTMGDLFRGDMEYEGKGDITFRDWCRQQTGPFKKFFDDCKERFILLNNRETDGQAMIKQRKEIIELAHQLHKINGRYTSDAFEQAKDLRERYIIQQKVPILSEKIQEICASLMADLQTYLEKSTEDDKVKIKERIATKSTEDDKVKIKETIATKSTEDDKVKIKETIAATKKEIKVHDKDTKLLKPLLKLVERIEESLDDIEELRKLTQELEDSREAKSDWTGFGSFCAVASGIAGAVGGVSLWTTLLAFTMPPVAVAVSAGTAAVSVVATGINYLQLSEKENTTIMKQDQTKSRLEKAGLKFNKSK